MPKNLKRTRRGANLLGLLLFFCLFSLGIAYAADNASFLSQNIPYTMYAGQAYTCSITLQNTGDTIWTKYNNYKLGSQNPQDNQTWGFGRVLLADTEVVRPTQSKTFTFTVTAPKTPGTYNFQWRMVKEGVAWFGAYTQNLSISVLANDNASFVSQNVPTTMTAGQSYAVSITIKNTGSTTWIKATNYKLGSENPKDNKTWGIGRVLLSDTDSIASGRTKTFSFNVTPPTTPGTYNFQWRMLKEGVAWFGDYTQNLSITVPNSSPTVGTVTSSSKSAEPDQTVTFTTTYSDANGWQNIQEALLLINTSITGANCLWVSYHQNDNTLYLINDAGTAWSGGVGFSPGSAKTLENSYAKLDCAKTTFTGSGNTLTITWSVAFKSKFTGIKNIYLYVKDDANSYQYWIKKGDFAILRKPLAPP